MYNQNIQWKDMDTDKIQKIYNDLRLMEYECEVLQNATYENDTNLYCPPIFDSYICWPRTLAGQILNASCPNFVVGWDERRLAFKECLEDGTWFRHPAAPHNPSWTNYTTCVDFEDFQFRQFINNLYIIGYSVSLAAILISLVIFLYFRNLRCTRISIHIHLFLSFVFNNCMWIIWYRAVVGNLQVLNDNPSTTGFLEIGYFTRWIYYGVTSFAFVQIVRQPRQTLLAVWIHSHVWCQGLHLIIQYLMVANYVWMFCEGLHLHLALVVVFVEDKLAMKCFIVLGWIVPAVLVIVYGSVRGASSEDRARCWMQETNSIWILTAPVCISLIASMVFLINVVRVLLTKLHPSSARPAPLGMRKAVRATLILVPLFGLHFILIPFRPDQGSPAEHTYQTFSAVLVSMQGFCVACLFCFANHDVLQTVRDRFRNFTGQHFDSIGVGMNGNTNTKDVVV